MIRERYLYDDRIAEDYTAGKISGIGNENGAIYWEMTPGTAPASAANMYVGEWLSANSTTAFLRIYFSGASSVTLQYADGKGNTGTAGYDSTSGLASGTSYQCKLEYKPEYIDWRIDNTSVAKIDATVDWGQDPPVRAFWGGNSSAGADGVYTSTTFSKPTMDNYKFSDQYD